MSISLASKDPWAAKCSIGKFSIKEKLASLFWLIFYSIISVQNVTFVKLVNLNWWRWLVPWSLADKQTFHRIPQSTTSTCTHQPSICHKKKTLRLKKQARWTTTYSLPDLQKMTPFEGNGWNYVYKKAHLMIDGQRLELQLCIFWSLPLSFLEIQSNENGIQIINKAVRYH